MTVATQSPVEAAVSVSPSALDLSLKAIKPVASARNAVQALSGVLLTADDGGLHLTASNLETTVRRRVVDTLVYNEMDALVSIGLIQQAVKALAKCEAITFAHDTERSEVIVKGGKRTIRLKCLRRDDFPAMPDPASYPHEVFVAEAADFASVFGRAIPFASGDETRPVLTGVCMDTDNMVAVTDSYRLAVLRPQFDTNLPVDATGEAVKINVPARALKLVLRNVKSGTMTMRVDPDDMRWVGIENVGANERWLIRRIDGQYPNHRQLIPDHWEMGVQMPTARLKAAAELAVQFCQKNAPMRVSVNGKVTVSGVTPDVCSFDEIIDGAEVSYTTTAAEQHARTTLGQPPMRTEGEELEIGFNPDFMLDIAKTVVGDTCTLHIISPLRPGLVRDGEDHFLIMPIRLNV